MSGDGQLSLLAPQVPVRRATPGQLRLVTWNVQHSAPQRARRQVAWLAERPEADVVVLTEVTDSAGGRALIRELADRGYQVIAPADTGGDYRVVLAAASGIDLHAVEHPVPVLPHRLVTARLRLGGRTVGVAGLYVPSRGPQERRNEAKRAFQDAVSAWLPRLREDLGDGPVVVAGDLNVLEPGHQPHYPIFGDWEYAFYRDFARAGLVDAFRALHPEAVEHSWYGRAGNGYRFDHAFIGARDLDRLQACHYLHQPRLGGLSDHAALAVVLTLDESRTAPAG
ncbi:Endonuclease/exonuclease/phosphatase [Carbonactinospora thermoautotrophica]|uniref:Endonuclease/exonuclease/phosphatase n=1 Tax=Carbonactinospora thermoautotrophica TaxID=1469144 RepID=A0A132MWK3_9ACTN|nr:endonuclease/exonuclease/phosphatase family protein [Carbonactinospora thermoautotrophica]KWX02285.1 Endonuclease/exonuclease/phosphatase [Carbonactinospora thermoautotrophica]